MNEVTVHFYGVLAEIAGTRQTIIKDITTIDGLKNHMNLLYPNMNKHNYIIAVNNKLVGNGQSINQGSTISIMPPFSGG